MRIVLFTILAAAIGAACSPSAADNKPVAKSTPATNSSPALPPVNLDTPKPIEAAKISLADAKKAFDEGDAVFVDVRSAESFNSERVKGAVNIGIGDIDANLAKLPKDKKIVVYCSCGAEHSSLAWVAKANQKGINNAYALIGGTAAWMDAGYPAEKQKPAQ